MPGKTEYAQRLRKAATDFTRYEEMCEKLARIFSSRGYDAGTTGTELTEADLADLNIELADVQAFVVMFDDMRAWLDANDHRQVLDRLGYAHAV